MKIVFALILAFALKGCELAPAAQIDFNRLADSIRIEEGKNPHWFYGIHHASQNHLSEAKARNRCVALCEREYALWEQRGRKGSYFRSLSRVYCPLNAESWRKNVEQLYKQKRKGEK
jgi:hypothetical protein